MSELLTPKKIDLSTINGGKRLENGSGYTPETFNAPIEASAFAQALATNQPNVERANQVGTPSVTIETLPDGTPRLVFENLKGEQGEKGETGSGGGETTLPDNLVTTDTAQTISGVKTFSNPIKTKEINWGSSSLPDNLIKHDGSNITVGDTARSLKFNGYGYRPQFRGGSVGRWQDVALLDDIPSQADYVTETWESSSGTIRWRKWYSGLLEIWGTVANVSVEQQVYFPVNFADNNYCLVLGSMGSRDANSYEGGVKKDTKTVSGFVYLGTYLADDNNNNFSYYACGKYGGV